MIFVLYLSWLFLPQKGHFSKNHNISPKNELPSDFIFVYNRVIFDQWEMIQPTSEWNLQSRLLTFSPRVPKNDFLRSKSPPKILIPKINIKPVADIVFDLRNEFHANRMKFGILGVKSFQRQFWPILNSIILKIENFGENWSSRAGNWLLAYFCVGNLGIGDRLKNLVD